MRSVFAIVPLAAVLAWWSPQPAPLAFGLAGTPALPWSDLDGSAAQEVAAALSPLHAGHPTLERQREPEGHDSLRHTPLNGVSANAPVLSAGLVR